MPQKIGSGETLQELTLNDMLEINSTHLDDLYLLLSSPFDSDPTEGTHAKLIQTYTSLDVVFGLLLSELMDKGLITKEFGEKLLEQASDGEGLRVVAQLVKRNAEGKPLYDA